MRAIVLNGTVGSGKTTILREIGEVLDEREAPYAIVDLDWLAWVRPAIAADMTVADVLAENLGAVAHTFVRAGVQLIVLARYVRTTAELQILESALGGADVTVVSLTAPPEVIEDRLRSRDTARQLAEHLELLHTAPSVEIGCHCVENDGTRPARDVAVEVLERAGW